LSFGYEAKCHQVMIGWLRSFSKRQHQQSKAFVLVELTGAPPQMADLGQEC
jgi:hypothetical protein